MMDKDGLESIDYSERRRYERNSMVSELTYKTGNICGRGKSRDISEGGMCAVLDRRIPVTTVLEMKFVLPGGDLTPIEAVSRIVWHKQISEGFLTGVKFGI